MEVTTPPNSLPNSTHPIEPLLKNLMTSLKDAIELTFRVRPTWMTGKSVQTSRINTNHCLRLLGEELDIATIKPSTFTLLGTQLIEEGKSPATVNRIFAALGTCLKECHLENLLENVPSYRRMKEPPSRKDYYSQAELKTLLAVAPSMDEGELLRDSILFIYLTGCRKAELVDLEWSDVDLENKTLTFRDTKNGEDHEMAIHKDLQSLLETLKENRIDERVFTWLNAAQFGYYMKKLCKKTGIGLREDGKSSRTIHQLRHTCATDLVTAGVPIKSIQAVLNHKKIETTMKYAHDTAESIANAVNEIPSLIN